MKKLFILTLILVSSLAAQNRTTVSASNISYLKNTNKITGKICLVGTDASDRVISFKIGGVGQAATVAACFPVTAGVIAANSTVPNPALTAPANVRYRIEVSDSSGVVIRYKNVSFSGATFDFDTYIPTTTNLVSGQSVDTLTVAHLRVTADCVGAGCGTGGGSGTTYTFNSPLSESAGSVSIDLSAYASLSALTSGLSGKANTSHTHTVSQVSDFLCSVDGQVWKRVAGTMQCAADATGAGGTAGVSSFNGSTGDVTYAPAWTDVTGKPTLFSGSYTDLTNKPSLFSGSYTDLTNKPTIPAAQVQTDWNAISGLGVLLNKPTLFDGQYSSLTGKPSLFDGTWASLSGKPTTFAPSSHVHVVADISDFPVLFDGQYASLTGKPTLFSGSYTDLTNKPTIPTAVSQLTNDSSFETTTHAASTYATQSSLTSGLSAKLDSSTAATTYAPIAQPFQISNRYVGMPASSTVLFDVLIGGSVGTLTIPSGCSGSILKSATSTNATGTATFTLSKITAAGTTTTLCTFTTAAGSAITTPSGSGGTLTSTDRLKFAYDTADPTYSDPIWVIAGTR